MSTSISLEMDAFFDRWKAARPEYKPFCNDGVLCDDIWNKQSPKIAFILKESNDDFCNIRGNCWGPDGNSHNFWRNINMWSYAVKELRNGNMPTFEEAQFKKENPVDHIAYINLKKWYQNKPQSDDVDIQQYVVRDWKFIDEQISLIAPEVIFCGGTFRYMSKRLKQGHIAHGVYRWGKRLVIDFYHPSGRKGFQSTFNQLKKMLESIPAT